MNLTQIEYFATTAETLSFTKTAEALSVTQQAVSKGIASLEREFGATLFERGAGGLSLTEEGRRARCHAEETLQGASRLAESIRLRNDSAKRPRTLHIGVSDVVLGNHCALSLDDVLSFERERRNIELDVLESTSDGCQDMLASGDADAVIITGRADYRRFRVKRLEERPFLPFVGSSHRLAGKDAVSVSDLVRETFVVPYGASSVVHEICEAFYDAGVEVPSPGQFVSHECSVRLMMEHVYRGEGVAFMRDNNLGFIDPVHGTVLNVPSVSFKARLSVATRRDAVCDAVLNEFVEYLSGLF